VKEVILIFVDYAVQIKYKKNITFSEEEEIW
jgi:hypothetical protein